jgi:hypothetical protein
MLRVNMNKKQYYIKLLSACCIITGSFLLLEHLFVWEGFDLEVFGHETYGIILIVTGFLLGLFLKRLR